MNVDPFKIRKVGESLNDPFPAAPAVRIFHKVPDIGDSAAKDGSIDGDADTIIINSQCKSADRTWADQHLSISAVFAGKEEFFLENRRYTIDEDSYLILNKGQAFTSKVRSTEFVHIFSIAFRPGIVEQVIAARAGGVGDFLEDPELNHIASYGFLEFLRPHDEQITPLLKVIEKRSRNGFDDPLWFEEQIHALVEAMLVTEVSLRNKINELGALRKSSREELFKRLLSARDYVLSNYDKDIKLSEIASVAYLSTYHFLRLFKRTFGYTPAQFLASKRISTARRLLARYPEMPISQVASAVGFDSRSTLFRNFKKYYGKTPVECRRQVNE
ncbi:MAG: AraC family transcriptional regulator [Gammaproteobacteria bacterium]|nr:AraC family transcriptional regulator [Gammaproteobacteria bacterium]